jgi:predicted nucleotidyltransferase
MIALLAENRNAIAALCRRYGVRRLDVFGSAGGAAAFDAARSDLDFVVEFEELPERGLFDRYFDLKEALETLLALPVDLVTEASIVNPYFRESVAQSRERLYGA